MDRCGATQGMTQVGLPRRSHLAHICGLLSLPDHQAHRRMTGFATWSLQEFHVVAMHHRKTPVSLFGRSDRAMGQRPALQRAQ